ncbi:MAG: glycosyltransferase, partial [Candidatus Woesearchaeota archaeon]
NKKFKFYLISEEPINKKIVNNNLFEKIIYIKQIKTNKPFKEYKKIFNFIFEAYKSIKQIDRNYKINKVIISHYIFTIPYLFYSKKNNYIFWFHGIKNNYFIFKDTTNHYLIFLKILENLSLFLAKKIIIPTNYSHYLIKKLCLPFFNINRSKIIILNNLINKLFLKKQKNIKKQNLILYSGRLVFKKGVENLILAFKKASIIYKNWNLLIIYPKTKNEDEDKILKKYKKCKNIIFKKDLSINIIRKYYQQAKLAILPSYLENDSLFLKEAIFINLPIFSTKTGSALEILNNKFFLNDNKPFTIEKKITSFINNQDYYNNEFVKIINNFKSNYKTKEIINKFIQIIYEN